MLKELVQELNQILTDVETLTNENRELKAEKETISSQLLAANESFDGGILFSKENYGKIY